MCTVSDVLESKGHDVYTVTEGATIDDAVATMCRVKVGAVVVVEETTDGWGLSRPTGMLSERDLLVRVLLAHRDPGATRVRDVMTRGIISIDEDESVEAALGLMNERRCRHLPVVRRGSIGLVGLVSIGDLVKACHSEHEVELRALHDYVEGRYPG
jgi:CBS domain-containing protein